MTPKHLIYQATEASLIPSTPLVRGGSGTAYKVCFVLVKLWILPSLVVPKSLRRYREKLRLRPPIVGMWLLYAASSTYSHAHSHLTHHKQRRGQTIVS